MRSHRRRRATQRSLGITAILWVLLGLFCVRVAAQLIQALAPVSLLPAFQAWHSPALPYPLLVATQVVIITVYAWIACGIQAGRTQPDRRLGRWLLGLGGVYFAFMLVRLVLGTTLLQETWFDALIPSGFHLVLAALLLVVGSFHFGSPLPGPTHPKTRTGAFGRSLPYLAYPVVMIGGAALHLLLLESGLPLLVSTYVPVFLGMATVTWLEVCIPHQRAWKARPEDVKSDLLFMLIVQGLLPTALSFLAGVSLIAWLQTSSPGITRLWPRELPIGIQLVIMILVADFLRYWFHVLSHHHPFFWRFHAVHHSPEKLYWLNVGRFHPVEKALQFFLDALPFIVLGVTENVLALYFVFYALNGFFQHSNVELRMGFLNWVISSAELHRWHHSRVVAESNSNFGNNVIVWDILFGSRFFPTDREVADLGLERRGYPQDFMSQVATPFRVDPDTTPADGRKPD